MGNQRVNLENVLIEQKQEKMNKSRRDQLELTDSKYCCRSIKLAENVTEFKQQFHTKTTESMLINTSSAFLSPSASSLLSLKRTRGKRRRLSPLLLHSIALGITIVCTLSYLPSVSANHALSEVWSEADGLSLKYSTNHDDLLSTKGSELSLGSDKREQQHQPESGGETEGSATAGESGSSGGGGGESNEGAAEESNAGETTGSGGESGTGGSGGGERNQQSASNEASDESQESGGGGGALHEQGADSSSRQTEKIPIGGRVSSLYASSASNQQRAQQHKYQNLNPTQSFRSVPAHSQSTQSATSQQVTNDDESNDFDGQSRASSNRLKSTKSSTAKSAGLSFASAQQSDNDDGVPPAPTVDESAEQANSAEAPDSDDNSMAGSPPGSYGSARLKQPSRLFKEAVRMNSGGSSTKSDSETNGNGADESSDGPVDEQSSALPSDGENENESSSEQAHQHGGRARGQHHHQQAPAAAMSDSSDADENELTGGIVDSVESSKQSMAALRGRLSHSTHGIESDNDNDEGVTTNDGPSSAFNQFRSHAHHSSFHDHSAARAPLASSNKERAIQQQQQNTNLKQKTQAAPSTSSTAPQSPQAYKQLAYFRGLNNGGDQANRAAPAVARNIQHQQYQGGVANPMEQQQQQQQQHHFGHNQLDSVDSPDSVRDNFISPGHFPGSMPHLTQAASEFQVKGSTAAAATETSEVASKVVKASGEIAPSNLDSRPAESKTLATNIVAASTTESQLDDKQQDKQSSQQQQAKQEDQQESTVVKVDSGDSTTMAASEATASKVVKSPSPSAASLLPQQQQQQQQQRQQQQQADASSAPATTNELPFSIASLTVTAEPAAQAQEQQIMAPTLLAESQTTSTTTTMAPMVPTTSSTQAPSVTENGSASSTTQAPPTLKRFKFRKYR